MPLASGSQGKGQNTAHIVVPLETFVSSFSLEGALDLLEETHITAGDDDAPPSAILYSSIPVASFPPAPSLHADPAHAFPA